MNLLRFLQWLLLALLTAWAVSCGFVSPGTSGVRFHDKASANCVVRFYDWNSIHIIYPDTREGGFLPLLDREGVIRRLGDPHLDRGLAVVVLGYMFTTAQEADLIQDWKALLRERGFHRVVFLRAGFKNEINGLLILHDSAMSAACDKPG